MERCLWEKGEQSLLPILWIINLRVTPGSYPTLIQEHVQGIPAPGYACGGGQGERAGYVAFEKIKMVIMAGESVGAGILSCKDCEGHRCRRRNDREKLG